MRCNARIQPPLFFFFSFRPVLIKSHFPFIGEPGVEEFTRKFNKIIHLTRNPFDNVASRFLGNSHKFQDRWDALLAARAKNKTTPVFDAFVKSDVKAYVRFHRYWLQRRVRQTSNRINFWTTSGRFLCPMQPYTRRVTYYT